MNTKSIFFLALTALVVMTGCSHVSPETPVERFYALYLELHPSGLPTREQEQTLAPYLSERLLRLLDKARSCQETFKRKYPEEKPPWADGCLFASLFEGPRDFEIVSVAANPDGASTVTVRFRYETYFWEDKVIISREADRFVIDEFVLSGAGPFNPPHRFSEGLRCPGE